MKRYRSIDLVFERDYVEMMAKKDLYTDSNATCNDSIEPEWDGCPTMSVACISEIEEIEVPEGFTY